MRDARAHAEAVAPPARDVLHHAGGVPGLRAVLPDLAAPALAEDALILKDAPPRVLAEEAQLPPLPWLPAQAEPPDVRQRLREDDVLRGSLCHRELCLQFSLQSDLPEARLALIGGAHPETLGGFPDRAHRKAQIPA